jgi:hypothetical protein
MTSPRLIRDLFRQDVTRDIPPVVYFHEQSPEKVRDEVEEYIITGGWNKEHPNFKRVPDGIHEQYVRLLTAITRELEKSGGPSLPTAWISGFYGSGKSSFAKLLGLSLDGLTLPNGKSLAESLLARDLSDRAQEFRDAWKKLRQRIEDPFAVVFDIGGFARDNEHIHSACVRQVQKRLGYCADQPLVANFELRLEMAGHWARFLQVSEQIGHPWLQEKNQPFADEVFSEILHHFEPDRYTNPMSWIDSRAGTTVTDSPSEAVAAIGEMLRLRRPGGTLFIVVDEVSQYVLSHEQRVDKLRAFASELGSQLKGRAWLLSLGQQKIDEEAGESFLVWAKDRFPPQLRVHLAATNIRDVVHRRLLQKTPDGEVELRRLFEQHRPDLKLFAFGCEDVSADEFVEVYPLLPGQIDLLLQITSAMRIRSARAQGDDQAIRGLLQLLGELFRVQNLADSPVGSLITLDAIYEIQKTALDSDTQASMARILTETASLDPMFQRAAKAVALLELVQDTRPTDARLVAQCLYDRVDRGNQVEKVLAALESLRQDNLLAWSEKLGYRIQSTAGEEWEREKREIRTPREAISEIVRDALRMVMEKPERPTWKKRPFPWAAFFSDGKGLADDKLMRAKDEAVVFVDFRFVQADERSEAVWIERSNEATLNDRLIWVCGDVSELTERARLLIRARGMARRYTPRRETLTEPRRLLLQQEELKAETLEAEIQDVVQSTWQSGTLYFRGKTYKPEEFGSKFSVMLLKVAERIMPILYKEFDPIVIQPSELEQLLMQELSGPSTKFLRDELGLLELDAGKYVPTCSGLIPTRIRELIESEDGVTGAHLLNRFAGPPYAYQPEVIRACVLGLLRGSKLKIEDGEGNEITAVRDAGVREVFEKPAAFRRAQFIPVGEDDIGVRARARICKFFEEHLGIALDREDNAIADAVERRFNPMAAELREVLTRFDRVPGARETPTELTRLNAALERCLLRIRNTRETLKSVKKHLDDLIDGVKLMRRFGAELTEEALRLLREAQDVAANQAAQLRDMELLSGPAQESAGRITAHLTAARPWVDIVTRQPELEIVRQTYREERARLLEWQGQRAEQARANIRSRDGYSTLPADKAHNVIRPINEATTDTTADAISPALRDLRDSFIVRLQAAEERANRTLDEYRNTDSKHPFVPINLGLQNREVKSEAEVDALIEEIRERLLQQLRNGQRIRLL